MAVAAVVEIVQDVLWSSEKIRLTASLQSSVRFMAVMWAVMAVMYAAWSP